jgi:hypothetical protein
MTKSKTPKPPVQPTSGGRFVRNKATGGIAQEKVQKTQETASSDAGKTNDAETANSSADTSKGT